MDKVAVLLPVYAKDNAEWFRLSLDSVLSQKGCRPIVYVGVDGPVGENIRTVLEHYADRPDVRIHSFPINRGLTAVLNNLIDVAVQSDVEFIARMDADDISLSDRFAKQVGYLQRHPEVMVIGGSIQEFNATNDCVNIRHYPETNDEVIKYICKASPCAHPATMIRRAIFDNGISYNENYRTSQDIALWYDVICAGYNIGNLNDVVLKFRLTDDIFKRRSWAYAKNEFKIYFNGIYRLYGFFSWRYIYPLFRLIFRLMPVRLIRWFYNSKVRLIILQKNVQT